MSEMRIAAAAFYFGADHSVGRVGFLVDSLIFERGGEAGPAAAGVKFCFGAEQWSSAADTFVGAGRVGGFILASEGWLRSPLSSDIILVRRELFLPFAVGLLDLFGHVSSQYGINTVSMSIRFGAMP